MDLTGSAAGRIIFVGANLFHTGLPLQTHVAVAKAGINALSGNLAIELGPLGVTSNVIAPGPIGNTEGMDRLTPHSDTAKDTPRKIPLGRWGSVKDIANATVYLFSDAGSYVNGDVLVGKWWILLFQLRKFMLICHSRWGRLADFGGGTGTHASIP
jgi:peroxisomal 2,4-dienoyl-CoA reductase